MAAEDEGIRVRRPPSRRWKKFARALSEIPIVTAGILIAFALDTWWDNHGTADREQVHLRALTSDFEQNVTALQALVRTEEGVMSSSQALLKQARATQPAEAASVVALMSEVFNSSRYEPVMGAYEALVNSGGLMLIRDESLRAALAKFAAQAQGTYSESWSNEHYFAFAREFGGTFMLYSWERDDHAADEHVVLEMLRNPRFQEHLVMRYYSERDMERKYRTLLQQAQSVQALLKEQIKS